MFNYNSPTVEVFCSTMSVVTGTSVDAADLGRFENFESASHFRIASNRKRPIRIQIESRSFCCRALLHGVIQVCGSPDIPLNLLKSVATYKGIDGSAALIQWFWDVMEEFTNTERSLFLRFVWGRTRLPRTIADFRGRDFVIQVVCRSLHAIIIIIIIIIICYTGT